MLVPLESSEGRHRLREALEEGTAQPEVVESFRRQRGNTVCGLASLAIVLTAAAITRSRSRSSEVPTTTTTTASALLLGERESTAPDVAVAVSVAPAETATNDVLLHHRVDEDDVYKLVGTVTSPTGAAAAAVVSEDKVRTSGLTLDQATALARALPSTERAVALFAVGDGDDDGDDGTETETGTDAHTDPSAHEGLLLSLLLLSGPRALRDIASEVLSSDASRESLLVNYHMTALGQSPFGGHLSPLAAYHAASDSLLVMDVWHTSTEPVWASVPNLWGAMADAIDPESSRPRGLLRIVHAHR